MKMNNKLLIAMATVFVGVAIIGANVFAVGNSRRDNIKSKGNIDYANGTVVINSSDLLYLADEIDDLESEYKKNTLAALNAVGTYFKMDGTFTHDREEDAIASEDAKSLNFSSLFEGILQSQSVEHLAQQQAKDNGNQLLYYASAEAEESKDLTQTTRDINSWPVYIQPITEANLTAGTAGWVNGNLILGTGADNQSYYNQGYAEGYADHLPEDVRIEYVLHQHTDDCWGYADVRCYTTIKFEEYFMEHCSGCSGSDMSATSRKQRYTIYHESCGAESVSGSWCTEHQSPPGNSYHTVNMYTTICNKTEDVTIDAAIIIYD